VESGKYTAKRDKRKYEKLKESETMRKKTIGGRNIYEIRY
jgi:hypothetical protein